MSAADITGFSGVAILLVAFLLNLLKKLPHNRRIYISLNLVGASLACTASVMINYQPFIILEGTWALVSLAALVKSFSSRS